VEQQPLTDPVPPGDIDAPGRPASATIRRLSAGLKDRRAPDGTDFADGMYDRGGKVIPKAVMSDSLGDSQGI
jgi:hypothetical protein